ncbi:MAG: hypothetical protein ACR65U_05735 [Methylocystis sp.]
MATDQSNTIKIVASTITQNTGGSPVVVDDALVQAINSAKAGGSALQSLADGMDASASFWSWLADNSDAGLNPFTEAVDPDGNPIMIISDGNMEMRYGAFYVGTDDSGDDGPTVKALGSIQTHSKQTKISTAFSVALSVTNIPYNMLLGPQLFNELLKPIYNNMKTLITRTARNIRSACQGDDPVVMPDEEAEGAVEDANAQVEVNGGELLEAGLEYTAINWTSALPVAAGMGALAAAPLIISLIAKKMNVDVLIVNMTDHNFIWSYYQDSGKVAVYPAGANKMIPKMDYATDSWGDKSTNPVAYEAEFNFINNTNLGNIGYLITLTPDDSSLAPANVLVSIPLTESNAIWVGPSAASPDKTYKNHKAANGKMQISHSFDSYTVTASINALHGKDDNKQYAYKMLVCIQSAA